MLMVSLGGAESLDCIATCKPKVEFFLFLKTNFSTNVQVKVSVEVNEHVEKLVRGAHVV